MWRVGVGARARACNNICCCIMFAQQTFPNQMSHMGSSAKNREAGRGVCRGCVSLPLFHIRASQKQDCPQDAIRFLFPLPLQAGEAPTLMSGQMETASPLLEPGHISHQKKSSFNSTGNGELLLALACPLIGRRNTWLGWEVERVGW